MGNGFVKAEARVTLSRCGDKTNTVPTFLEGSSVVYVYWDGRDPLSVELACGTEVTGKRSVGSLIMPKHLMGVTHVSQIPQGALEAIHANGTTIEIQDDHAVYCLALPLPDAEAAEASEAAAEVGDVLSGDAYIEGQRAGLTSAGMTSAVAEAWAAAGEAAEAGAAGAAGAAAAVAIPGVGEVVGGVLRVRAETVVHETLKTHLAKLMYHERVRFDLRLDIMDLRLHAPHGIYASSSAHLVAVAREVLEDLGVERERATVTVRSEIASVVLSAAEDAFKEGFHQLANAGEDLYVLVVDVGSGTCSCLFLRIRGKETTVLAATTALCGGIFQTRAVARVMDEALAATVYADLPDHRLEQVSLRTAETAKTAVCDLRANQLKQLLPPDMDLVLSSVYPKSVMDLLGLKHEGLRPCQIVEPALSAPLRYEALLGNAAVRKNLGEIQKAVQATLPKGLQPHFAIAAGGGLKGVGVEEAIKRALPKDLMILTRGSVVEGGFLDTAGAGAAGAGLTFRSDLTITHLGLVFVDGNDDDREKITTLIPPGTLLPAVGAPARTLVAHDLEPKGTGSCMPFTLVEGSFEDGDPYRRDGPYTSTSVSIYCALPPGLAEGKPFGVRVSREDWGRFRLEADVAGQTVDRMVECQAEAIVQPLNVTEKRLICAFDCLREKNLKDLNSENWTSNRVVDAFNAVLQYRKYPGSGTIVLMTMNTDKLLIRVPDDIYDHIPRATLHDAKTVFLPAMLDAHWYLSAIDVEGRKIYNVVEGVHCTEENLRRMLDIAMMAAAKLCSFNQVPLSEYQYLDACPRPVTRQHATDDTNCGILLLMILERFFTVQSFELPEDATGSPEQQLKAYEDFRKRVHKRIKKEAARLKATA